MSDPNICAKCIGDANFRDWIRKNGKRGRCEIDPSHGRGSKVLPASELAEKVDEFFRENYEFGGQEMHVKEDSDNTYYKQRGSSCDEIIMEHLECDEDVFRAIELYLPDVSDREIAKGAERFYDSSQLYENLKEAERRERQEEEEY